MTGLNLVGKAVMITSVTETDVLSNLLRSIDSGKERDVAGARGIRIFICIQTFCDELLPTFAVTRLALELLGDHTCDFSDRNTLLL